MQVTGTLDGAGTYPLKKLVDEFEEGDPGRVETILYSGKVDPLYGEEVPSTPTVPQPYWNKKVYTDPRDRLSLNSRFGQWMNHRIIRYADVLLMAAEAATEPGGDQNIQDALGWLEQVRARARGSNANIARSDNHQPGQLRDAIRHERFVELAMEEQRYYDLVRWGIDLQVLRDEEGKELYKEKKRLLPIPQAEIDKSGGVLEQNPL